jgi:hypothetical protein
MFSMVSPISSSPVITGSFPYANKAITDFIDALVSLKINPNEGFAKNLNDFSSSLNNGYSEILRFFENTEFPKILTLPSLINAAIQSFSYISSLRDPQPLNIITLLYGFDSSPQNISFEDFTGKINQYRNGKGIPSKILDYILKEFERRNVPNFLNTIYDVYKDIDKLDNIDNSSKLDFTHDELFGEDISVEDLWKSANSFQRNFKAIMDLDALINGNTNVPNNILPMNNFRSIAKNKNIIPAFKILNLRPLVRDLKGFMRLAGDENEVVRQVATALDQELTAKAPSEQLDNYKKLALAVFPSDIAGRLRAAGFAPTNSKA